jgi:hypothetical protein
MALIRSTSTLAPARTQFTIWSSVAGNGGTVYTVPSGKSFTGYVLWSYPYNGNWQKFYVNGQQMDINPNTTYGTQHHIPVYLGEGDVISNYSVYYFGLTGYEE